MQIFTGVSDLDGSEWCEEDVINLQRRLTDEEFEDNILEGMSDTLRLSTCARILNSREALPARYKSLVQDYAGSSKADPDTHIEF